MVDDHRAFLNSDTVMGYQSAFDSPWSQEGGWKDAPTVPEKPGPVTPEIQAEMDGLQSEIDALDARLQRLSVEKEQIVQSTGNLSVVVDQDRQTEIARQSQWTVKKIQHAKRTIIAGVPITITGIALSAVGGYMALTDSGTVQDLQRDLELQQTLVSIGSSFGSEDEIQQLEHDIERAQANRDLGIKVAFSVGVPLVGLGVLLIAAGAHRVHALKNGPWGGARLQVTAGGIGGNF